MTRLKATELDTMLRKLIANPESIDEVKTKLQRGTQDAQSKSSRWSSTSYDDLDDMFDNLPV